MKQILYNIGLIFVAGCLAIVCFDLVVWIGVAHEIVHIYVKNYSIVLLCVLSCIALRIFFIGIGSWRYDAPKNERIRYAAEAISVQMLSDENTYQLLKDNRRKGVRQYRNKVSGDLIITTYDKPKHLPGKNKGVRRGISVVLIIIFIVGCRAIPRISQCNRLICENIRYVDINAMSYFYDGNIPSSVRDYCEELKSQISEWMDARSIITSDKDDDQYIFSDSDSRILTEEDIEGMDSQAIQMAINEIYARRGYAFLNDKKAAKAAREYFLDKDWYTPTIESMKEVEKTFSKVERKNIDFLVKYR